MDQKVNPKLHKGPPPKYECLHEHLNQERKVSKEEEGGKKKVGGSKGKDEEDSNKLNLNNDEEKDYSTSRISYEPDHENDDEPVHKKMRKTTTARFDAHGDSVASDRNLGSLSVNSNDESSGNDDQLKSLSFPPSSSNKQPLSPPQPTPSSTATAADNGIRDQLLTPAITLTDQSISGQMLPFAHSRVHAGVGASDKMKGSNELVSSSPPFQLEKNQNADDINYDSHSHYHVNSGSALSSACSSPSHFSSDQEIIRPQSHTIPGTESIYGSHSVVADISQGNSGANTSLSVASLSSAASSSASITVPPAPPSTPVGISMSMPTFTTTTATRPTDINNHELAKYENDFKSSSSSEGGTSMIVTSFTTMKGLQKGADDTDAATHNRAAFAFQNMATPLPSESHRSTTNGSIEYHHRHQDDYNSYNHHSTRHPQSVLDHGSNYENNPSNHEDNPHARDHSSLQHSTNIDSMHQASGRQERTQNQNISQTKRGDEGIIDATTPSSSSAGTSAAPTAATAAAPSSSYTIDDFSSWRVGPRYELIRILGRGSFGEVAQARDLYARRSSQDVVRTGMDSSNKGDSYASSGGDYSDFSGGSSDVKDEQQISQRGSSNDGEAFVAIKRIKAAFEQEVDAVRLYREMHILRRLRGHDCIIQLLDIVPPESEDLRDFRDLYLVFEYVDTDLYKLIMSPQYLTTEHIQTFLYQMLTGLKYIHSSSVIHRDLKPANILLNEDCSLKICDFGLARIVNNDALHKNSDENGDSELSKTSNFKISGLTRQLTKHVVTRWYRAPELILIQPYTSAVDIWSLGCILAELLSMEEGSVPGYQDRVPLFPGGSCYPLSGEGGSVKPNERLDQLSVIFGIIGTPSAEDLESTGKANEYIKSLKTKPGRPLESLYPAADEAALDLLKKMLQFNPKKRCTAEEALEHEFLKGVRRREMERNGDQLICPRFLESNNISIAELKRQTYKEVMWYKNHKNVVN